jgi:DNA-binding winged helix-turn-helix (wHTH) protein
MLANFPSSYATSQNHFDRNRAASHTPGMSGAIQFGEFRLVPSTRSLTRDDSPVHLGDRALDILIALIDRAGQVVSATELYELVWPDTYVEKSALRVHMSALRKALGDRGSGQRFVVSIRGRGYTFVAEVERTSVRDVVDALSSAAADSGDGLPEPLLKIGRDEIIGEIAGQLLRILEGLVEKSLLQSSHTAVNR